MEFTKAEEKLLKDSFQAEKMSKVLMILGPIMAVLCAGSFIWKGATTHIGTVYPIQMGFGFLLGTNTLVLLMHAYRHSSALVLIRKLQQLSAIETD